MSLTISLLGPLRVTDDHGRDSFIEGFKARCILVILALARGTVVPADRLIDELWDGCPPPQPEASFHAHVCRLRRALATTEGPSPIVTRKPGYELDADRVDVDVDRFERLAGAARATLADGDPAAARAHAQGGLQLWRGPALVEFRDRSFAAFEVLRLEDLRRAVAEDGIDAALMLGQHEGLVAELDQLVAAHPFHERLHGQRMLALYRSGRQADALRAYRHAATLLRDELGIAPGPALRDLEAAILRQDPELGGDKNGGDLVGAAQHATRRAANLWVRAGDEAMSRSVFKEAAHRYESAIGMLANDRTDEPDLHNRAVLALGDARHADYERAGAREAYLATARQAVAARNHERLAHATWGLTAVTEFAGADPEAGEVLAVALQQLGSHDACLRARLLAAIARTAPPADTEARERIAEAVELARRNGDPATLAVTVSTWCLVCWGPDRLAERERYIEESIRLSEDVGWTELAMEARNWLSATAWEAGDLARSDAELARVVHWQRGANRPFFRCLTALRLGASLLRRGQYEAAQANLDTMPLAAHASPDFLAGFAGQLFALRRDQGRLAELGPLVDDHVGDPDAAPAWAAAAAVTQLASGRSHEARITLHRLLAHDHALPRDWLWLAAMTHLADVAVGLNDVPAAAHLLSILRPYGERQVVLAHGILTTGSAARSVAELASLVGNHAEAEQRFAQALEANGRWECQPWLVRTRFAFARHLRRVGDERGATEMHGESVELAGRLGAALA